MHPVLWFIFVNYKLHIITHKHIGWLVELSEEEHNTERKHVFCGPADNNKTDLSAPGLRSTWLK